MKPPKYTGTIHPEEWLKQVQTYCYIKRIENEQNILKICKLMIDSTIIIPNEINSIDELIKALKSHPTFEIFKTTCIEKLKLLKYVPGNTATFLANFRSLCNDTEINNPEEIKEFLINSYLNDFFKGEFTKCMTGINSVDEILIKFSDVVFEELKTIKYGSLIALKHVATGKYLSSCKINYQTGPESQAVFAGEKFPDTYSLWYATCETKKVSYQNTVFYDDKFNLTHKATDCGLLFRGVQKSPTSKHRDVYCSSGCYSSFNCVNANPTNNNTPYVKSKDVITLKGYKDHILRSHDFTFSIGDKTFQEVVGHKERIGGNDEWQIELIEDIEKSNQ